ncbi:Patatin-like phospholipase [Pseudomonas luteola]|uniref:Patatin-like phospholipase n=2 Tax=Pseudomonas luteola TaxID=47886 RepID=A0A2X2CC74_PSELU|nr:Patatin-like phospholipase [Pseudomonas luteola]
MDMRISVALSCWSWLIVIALGSVGCSTEVNQRSTAYSLDFTPTLSSNDPEEPRKIGSDPPRLGLALAGGGTKAAVFSIGVLQGLVESGLMDKVDVISSVSGGGYAAYWYYTRLVFDDPNFEQANATSTEFRQALFLDCIPSRYHNALNIDWQNPKTWPKNQPHPCPQTNNTNLLQLAKDEENKRDDKSQTREDNYRYLLQALEQAEPSKHFGTDPYRYQNYLRGYQDIFSTGRNLFGVYAFDYKPTTEDYRFTNETVEMLPLWIGSIIVNAVTNIAFDWNLNVSSTQYAYAKGIARTYGASVPNCEIDRDACITTFYGNGIRKEGNIELAKSLTFSQLMRAYEVKGAPLWVINATAGEDRKVFDVGAQQDFSFTAYEISPYQHGSGIYGYKEGSLPGLMPFEAVMASAAFFDSQQKVLPLKHRILLNPLQKLGAFDWGRSIRNPVKSDMQYTLHHFLPFPIYLADRFADAKDSMFIHLSDGGMSENLGAYALIRRRVSTLIVSDHSFDRKGSMGDICRLKRGLEKQDLYLLLPGLEHFDKQCSGDPELLTGYDINHWSHPVLAGCIVSKAQAYMNCEKLEEYREEGQYAAHLFVIKPAWGTPPMQDDLETIKKLCSPHHGDLDESTNKAALSKARRTCEQAVIRACTVRNNTDESPMWAGAMPPSCEVYAFLRANIFNEKGIASDGCPYFPQFETKVVTMDSSPWIFGAMRDLATYYTKRVTWFFTEKGTVNEDRFIEELRYQREHQLPLLVNAELSSSKCDPQPGSTL